MLGNKKGSFRVFICFLEGRNWKLGYGRWKMGDGSWDMGDGRWEMGWGLLPSLGLYSPEGASPIFNLPYPMLSSKEQKRGRSRRAINY
jgi:hypothetical protein